MRIFDGHNDSLTRVFPAAHFGQAADDFLTASNAGHLDLPRAMDGGMVGGLFAIFVDEPDTPDDCDCDEDDGDCNDDDCDCDDDENEATSICLRPRHVPQMAPPLPQDYAALCTNNVLSQLFALQRRAGSQFCLVEDAAELEWCLDNGVFAMVVHLEGAEAIDRHFTNLEVYRRAGVRSLGLVWSRPNLFGNGVPFSHPSSPDTGPGLTPLGRGLVRRCNQLGIMLDLAHLNEAGFYDVAELSNAPIVSSHTAAHALCASSRNLTDEQLHVIGQTNGIAGVTFHVGDLRPDGEMNPDTPLEVIVDHIVYIAREIGPEHVGLGSDFDGALIPEELGDATGLPRLVALLEQAGFSNEDLENILWRNWIRVLTQSWNV